jgi:hypothetical protein
VNLSRKDVPKMEILKFENAPQNSARKNKTSVRGLVAVAGFAAVAVLGSTLAANISLNSGQSIEFGQGVAVATACDTDGITVIPRSNFVNASNAGSFNLASISFTGIMDNCTNKLFTINAYGDTSATPLDIATSGATSFNVATFVLNATMGIKSSYINATSNISSTSADTAEIGFNGTQATSGAVFKITVQTSDN